MSTVLSVFAQGLSFGLVLFLLAAGLTLTMGLMRIVNMSHGALYMMGGYVGIAVNNRTHNWALGLIAGALCAGMIGLLMEVGFLRRLHKQESSQVLLTIGFIYILTNIAQMVWGAYPKAGPVPSVLSKTVPFGSVNTQIYSFFVIGFGLVLALLLWRFQDRSRIGAWVRAGMDNREITGTFGINLKRLFTGIFALGSLIAGLCGLVGAPMTNISLITAWQALLLSLVVVVIGGTGSILGALLGGLTIGLLNAFGTAYFPSFASYILYAVLIVVLLVRPSGFLGRKMSSYGASENLERASFRGKRTAWVESGSPDRSATPRWRRLLYRRGPYVIALAVLAVVPSFLGAFPLATLTRVLIFAVFAMSLDLLMGYTGLFSFGHAAFFGLGGYLVGVLSVHYGISSFWVILPMTIGATAIAAAAIGYLCLRVSGVYFLLVTMAFGQLLVVVAGQWTRMTGGTDGLVGIPSPDLGFSGITWNNTSLYYLVLVGFVICYFVLHRIAHSSFGRTLTGIRDNESRMTSLGYNTWALKYLAFIIASLFAGVAGLMFAYNYGVMVPKYLGLELSALPMLMVIIGGAGTLWGPCLGALVIICVQQYAGAYIPDKWPLILGALFVVCVLFLRGGLCRYLEAAWMKLLATKSARVELRDSPGNEVEP
jgi:branched-chain amino acid transport system permease protein